MATVKPIPDDYPRVSPVLLVDGAARAIAFYTEILGATERLRIDAPGGKVGHAELQIGDSLLMVADEEPDMDMRGPRSVGGTPVSLHVYVEDADAVFERAVRAGARELQPMADQFYGDRSGQFEDPFGHRWSVATHVEDVPDDEMRRRVEELMSGGADG